MVNLGILIRTSVIYATCILHNKLNNDSWANIYEDCLQIFAYFHYIVIIYSFVNIDSYFMTSILRLQKKPGKSEQVIQKKYHSPKVHPFERNTYNIDVV